MAIAIPRRASTTLIVRDHDARLQVLMLRRSPHASFMPGAYVFPGGAVDDSDDAPAIRSRTDDQGRAAAAGFVDLERSLAHAVAALRECFEECGLWLGVDSAP